MPPHSPEAPSGEAVGLKGPPEQPRALGSSWEVGGGWAGRYTYLDAGAGCTGLVPRNVHKGHCRVLCGVTLVREGSVTGRGGADQALPGHCGARHPPPLGGLALTAGESGVSPTPRSSGRCPPPPGSQRPQGRGWPGAVDGRRGATSSPGDTGAPGTGRGRTRRRPPGGGRERVRAGRPSSRLWGAGVRPSTHPLLTVFAMVTLQGPLTSLPPAPWRAPPLVGAPPLRGPRPLEAPFPSRPCPPEGSPGNRGCLKGHLTWKPSLVENCREAEGQGVAVCPATGGPPSRPSETGYKPPPPTVGSGGVRGAARWLDPGAGQGRGRPLAVGPLPQCRGSLVWLLRSLCKPREGTRQVVVWTTHLQAELGLCVHERVLHLGGAHVRALAVHPRPHPCLGDTHPAAGRPA